MTRTSVLGERADSPYAATMIAKASRRNPDVVRKAMTSVKSHDTTPEVKLRNALWRRGFRYRLSSGLPGKPDLVFPRWRTVIFVDGDFWHGRQWKTRGFGSLQEQLERVNNDAYWISKIQRNVARDAEVTRELERQGWRVLRIWESEVRQDLSNLADKVSQELMSARSV